MSTRSNSPIVSTRGASGDSADPARLAHELNNLLDGSLRHIGLAIRSLRTASQGGPTDPQALERLDTASAALRQRADRIHAWGDQPTEGECEARSGASR